MNSGWISAIIQHSFENSSDVLVELDGQKMSENSQEPRSIWGYFCHDFNCRLAQTDPLIEAVYYIYIYIHTIIHIVGTCFHIVGYIPIFSIIFPLYLYDLFLFLVPIVRCRTGTTALFTWTWSPQPQSHLGSMVYNPSYKLINPTYLTEITGVNKTLTKWDEPPSS